jgi:IS1 family transposase
MYHIRTPLARVDAVMTALSEGVDIAAATRIFGHHHTTISRWLQRNGQTGARLQERLFFRMVVTGHLQLDELVTRVKRDAERIWVWTAVAAKSKLILAMHLGWRSTEDACQLLHQVRERLVPGELPVFTSDGLNQYFYGLTAHFGYWHKPPRARKYHWEPAEGLQYAQLRKARAGYRVKFLYSIIRLGTRPAIRARLRALKLSGKVQTAYVERANLTLRELIAPLSRRTWSMAHDRYHLWLHMQWGLAYYHLVRPHQSLQVKVRGPSRHRYRTPAMAAGLTRRRWTVTELLLTPVPERIWLDPLR